MSKTGQEAVREIVMAQLEAGDGDALKLFLHDELTEAVSVSGTACSACQPRVADEWF